MTAKPKKNGLRKLYDRGRWFIVSRDMLAAFNIEETFMLSYLCNVGEQHEGKEWFPCPAIKMEVNLHTSEWTNKRIINQLVARRVLERRQMGNPAKRHFHINYEHMHQLIHAGLMKQ